MCVVFDLCYCLLSVIFTHILQGYFAGTRKIIPLPQVPLTKQSKTHQYANFKGHTLCMSSLNASPLIWSFIWPQPRSYPVFCRPKLSSQVIKMFYALTAFNGHRRTSTVVLRTPTKGDLAQNAKELAIFVMSDRRLKFPTMLNVLSFLRDSLWKACVIDAWNRVWGAI